MTRPIAVFRNMEEAREFGRDITCAIVATASMPHSMYIARSETVYVSEWASEVPGLLDTVRKRQEPFEGATLEVLPAEHIRPALGLGSAHERLRLAAFRAKQGEAP